MVRVRELFPRCKLARVLTPGVGRAVTLLNVVVAVLLDEFVQAVSREKEQV